MYSSLSVRGGHASNGSIPVQLNAINLLALTTSIAYAGNRGEEASTFV